MPHGARIVFVIDAQDCLDSINEAIQLVACHINRRKESVPLPLGQKAVMVTVLNTFGFYLEK